MKIQSGRLKNSCHVNQSGLNATTSCFHSFSRAKRPPRLLLLHILTCELEAKFIKSYFLLVCLSFCAWWKGCFGDQGNMKLTNRKTVQFFMKCLSDLVPYEPAEYLKVTMIVNHFVMLAISTAIVFKGRAIKSTREKLRGPARRPRPFTSVSGVPRIFPAWKHDSMSCLLSKTVRHFMLHKPA